MEEIRQICATMSDYLTHPTALRVAVGLSLAGAAASIYVTVKYARELSGRREMERKVRELGEEDKKRKMKRLEEKL